MTEKITRTKIFNSIVELSEQKQMGKLSIAEITRHAGLTRGSFYNHFLDLDDAMHSLEKERLEELELIINRTRAIHGADENEKAFYESLLEEINQHKRTFQQLLSQNGDDDFLKMIAAVIRPHVGIDRFSRSEKNKMIPKDFAENYVLHSIIDVILYWLEKSPDTPVSVVVDVLFNTRRLTPLEVSGIN